MSEQLTRRAALGVAGLTGLAGITGCAGGSGPETPVNLSGKEAAKVADVPVGGGRLNGELKLLVTQPTEGVFKVFTSRCPHQGCGVSTPKDGLADCPCHGSEFDITDGSVKKGPAKTGLREYPAEVKNGAVVVL
ncbi:Rieske (2Fe-2S) protein [Actinocorallia aurantiaca]|jgi:Rieske Fe-S protein|uniref:Cytochrome bc1 complex Rieske iron-sulfur subunit n=1 Tax=Actinocorallia aurantiaca TaxID=46204 RepID=A0ABN3UQC5_9ACTN